MIFTWCHQDWWILVSPWRRDRESEEDGSASRHGWCQTRQSILLVLEFRMVPWKWLWYWRCGSCSKWVQRSCCRTWDWSGSGPSPCQDSDQFCTVDLRWIVSVDGCSDPQNWQSPSRTASRQSLASSLSGTYSWPGQWVKVVICSLFVVTLIKLLLIKKIRWFMNYLLANSPLMRAKQILQGIIIGLTFNIDVTGLKTLGGSAR